MISFDVALKCVSESIQRSEPVKVGLDDANGLILAQTIQAHWDMPGSDLSAMDGYAVAQQGNNLSGPLKVVGHSYAGHPFSGSVSPGTAVRITTGAVLPIGADTVIPIEDIVEKDGQVFIEKQPKKTQNVRFCGEEYKRDEILLEPGTVLRAGEIALLASSGIQYLMAYRKPRVAVISTGDELVELGQTPSVGQIVNSNLYYIKNRLIESGCQFTSLATSPDHPETLEECIEKVDDADVVISTGGVSVGEKDLMQLALKAHEFKKIFWKVAMKPGKPILYGILKNRPFFGLPGNPAAAAVTYELFVQPALAKISGYENFNLRTRRGALKNTLSLESNRLTFLWCQVEWQLDRYYVTVSDFQGSGQNRCFAGTNALLPVPAGKQIIKQGQNIDVFIIKE